MADPILDEEMLVESLKCPIIPEASQQLQQVSLHCLVAAYDRQCVRDEFTTAMDAAMGLHSQMGKLFMLASIRERYTAGTLDIEMIDAAINKATSYASNNHHALLAFMERLVTCPTSADKVH